MNYIHCFIFCRTRMQNDFYVAAAEEAVNPETKKKKHPAAAKPDPESVKPAAPAHEKPAHEKPPAEKPKPPPKAPAKPDPPKPDPPKQHPPKQEHNHEYHEYYQYQSPVHHYQFVNHDQHHPSQLPPVSDSCILHCFCVSFALLSHYLSITFLAATPSISLSTPVRPSPDIFRADWSLSRNG